MIFCNKIAPILTLFLALFLVDAGVTVQYADARSKMGGRMFSRPMPKKAPAQQQMQKTQPASQQNKKGFGGGLLGGLMGGALAGMLFGSLFGAPGTGMGLLPILLLAGAGYFLFRRFAARAGAGHSAGGGFSHVSSVPENQYTSQQTDERYLSPVELGLEEIKQTDPSFDKTYFLEVASDVFFQIQAGWMRRDLSTYKHLLGEQLAREYQDHFDEMKQKAHINKLESIAIRKVEMVNGGSDGKEDFITVLFTANLLDYTIDEHTDQIVSGSDAEPVKFAEEWTWARPSGTQNWLLEGIKVVSE